MNKKDIIKCYRFYSRFYDFFLFGKLLDKGRDDAIKLMNCCSNDKVLEIGVGSGLSLHKYPEHVEITGIDISDEMIDRARQKVSGNKLKNVELIVADAEETVFDNNAFDKVVIMHALSVTPNPEKLLHMAKNVCKQNGDVIILNHFSGKYSPFRYARGGRFITRHIERKIGFRMDFSMDEYLSYIRKELNGSIVSILSTNFGFSDIIHIRYEHG